MKKLFCLIATVLMLTLTACGSGRNNTDLSVYERYAETDPILPSLEELGKYEAVQSLHHHDSALFFFWDAYHLIVSYDEAGYEQATEHIEATYTCRTETVRSERFIGHHQDKDDWRPVSYPPYCDLNGYHLRMLDTEGHGFPKDVYLIGENDKTHKIVYIRFYDIDLDSAESLESFLLDECGWSVLIKKNML